jgi:cytochrome c5
MKELKAMRLPVLPVVVLCVAGLFSSTAIADGETIYNSGCVACHGAGIAGAPRVGDKVAWVHRIAQGTEIIYEHALNGFQGTAGIMPAKGGFTHLSDEEVKAAIDFMIKASK